MVFFIPLWIFTLTPASIRTHSHAYPRSLPRLSALTPAHSRTLPLTLAHSRTCWCTNVNGRMTKAAIPLTLTRLSSFFVIFPPFLVHFYRLWFDHTFGDYFESEYAAKVPMLAYIAFWSLFFWFFVRDKYDVFLYCISMKHSKYHHLQCYSSYISSFLYK